MRSRETFMVRFGDCVDIRIMIMKVFGMMEVWIVDNDGLPVCLRVLKGFFIKYLNYCIIVQFLKHLTETRFVVSWWVCRLIWQVLVL